jgi:hypothetical protein
MHVTTLIGEAPVEAVCRTMTGGCWGLVDRHARGKYMIPCLKNPKRLH